VRAYTQLLDDSQDAARAPLFTDTYLSLPVVTEAGRNASYQNLPRIIHLFSFFEHENI